MPSGLVWAEVWSILAQTAGEAVLSFSQTFPAGTRAGLIALNPAFWRHDSNGITYTHIHQNIYVFIDILLTSLFTWKITNS